jgi:hypothetical protein
MSPDNGDRFALSTTNITLEIIDASYSVDEDSVVISVNDIIAWQIAPAINKRGFSVIQPISKMFIFFLVKFIGKVIKLFFDHFS